MAYTDKKTAAKKPAPKGKKTAQDDCPPNLSFAKDIKPLFTTTDISHMKRETKNQPPPLGQLDLSNYNSVVLWKDAIKGEIDSKQMPPPSGWPQNQITLFDCWYSQGCKP